ncbi:MAG: peptidoglycan-binding protein [Bacillota bacterium]
MDYNFKLTTVRKDLILKTTIILAVFLMITLLTSNSYLQAQDVFKPGQEDESVEELQDKLEELGFFSVTQTGLYGEKTRRAVERFQAAADLKPDGIAGPTTLDAIERALNSIDIEQRERLKIYTHNVDVIYLQYKLSQLGYLSSEPTGLFRSQTSKAVKEFQNDNDIDSNGIVNSSTWEALEEEFDKLDQTTYDSDNIDDEIEEETDEAADKAEKELEEDDQSDSPDIENMDIVRNGDSGEAVVKLQKNLKAAGIFPFSAEGNFGHQTEIAVRQFQEMVGLKADGVVGPSTWKKLLSEDESQDDAETSTYQVKSGDSLWTIANRFDTSINDIRAVNNLNGDSIRDGQKLKIPGDNITVSRQSVEAINWGQVTRLFPRNSTATLTDVETGLSFRVKRLYGTNHADVEPLTAQDTNVLRRIYGGNWSWDRRAVIVNIEGRLIAGSINGVPHGGQSINNNFNGHICLHFKGSRTHGGNRLDPDHQNMIKRSASQNWPLHRN